MAVLLIRIGQLLLIISVIFGGDEAWGYVVTAGEVLFIQFLWAVTGARIP